MKKNIVSIFLILVSLTGCAKKIPLSNLTAGQFFDLVYVATQYRAPGTTAWSPTSGLYKIQFLQDPASADASGTFEMRYTTYSEPNLCPFGLNCVCSGGIDGTFAAGPVVTPPTGGTYDPNNPYTPAGATTTTNTIPTDGSVAQIYAFNFALTIQVSTLTSGCANGHKFNQPVLIYRFANGELIVTNDTSQLYMIPQTSF